MKNTVNKGLFILALVTLATGGAFAQGYAPVVADNNFFINAGVGFGPTGGYNLGILPLSASVDFKLPIGLPITVGGIVTYTTWKFSVNAISVTYTNIGLGGRAMYHLNLIDKLDTYAGLTLGYAMQSAKMETGISYDTSTEAKSFFLWGGNIGARYFFTNLIGAYLELGYSSLQYVSIGASIKFL